MSNFLKQEQLIDRIFKCKGADRSEMLLVDVKNNSRILVWYADVDGLQYEEEE